MPEAPTRARGATVVWEDVLDGSPALSLRAEDIAGTMRVTLEARPRWRVQGPSTAIQVAPNQLRELARSLDKLASHLGLRR